MSRKTLGLAVVAILCLLALTLSVRGCMEARKAEREARNDRQMAEGRTVSATEAISEIGKLGERSGATDTEVKQAQEAVRNASPEDRRRVWVYRTCLLQHRTDCSRLLISGGGGSDDPDAVP